MPKQANRISTYNEGPLHASLKAWYAQPGDVLETNVDGFVIDIVRDDLLLEIQTRSFASMKRKLQTLTETHHVRLIHPIAREKWIVKLDEARENEISRRKSPKRGDIVQLFDELVSFPRLLADPNFSIEVAFIQEEEVRYHDARRGWRRHGWMTHERRLLKVVEQRVFEQPEDFRDTIPAALEEPFTTNELAATIPGGKRIAGRMAYCLRKMGVIDPVGKHRNAILYARATF